MGGVSAGAGLGVGVGLGAGTGLGDIVGTGAGAGLDDGVDAEDTVQAPRATISNVTETNIESCKPLTSCLLALELPHNLFGAAPGQRLDVYRWVKGGSGDIHRTAKYKQVGYLKTAAPLVHHRALGVGTHAGASHGVGGKAGCGWSRLPGGGRPHLLQYLLRLVLEIGLHLLFIIIHVEGQPEDRKTKVIFDVRVKVLVIGIVGQRLGTARLTQGS